tara:strand:- start:1506 stop:1772 length:267 start_codon:yes stop_codon:yes gene_type:complete
MKVHDYELAAMTGRTPKARPTADVDKLVAALADVAQALAKPPVVLPAAKVEVKVPPAVTSAPSAPVAYTFKVVRDGAGRIEKILATPT